ncbi:hypothetical protein LCGC14_1838600 [marine sediment metagenome]|uniref:Uncharacterized protein n=1 Tax=marine sediment metagenome TaxID=412755 RepID=A0A0F9GE14_9ZZZZ
MDKQRLLELAGMDESGDAFRDALKVIAAELAPDANFMDTGGDVEDVINELMQGRWTEQLRDEIRDQLADADRY